MPPEPAVKRAVVFVDGQNLYHAAREAFGYTYPNYDVLTLAWTICHEKGWTVTQTRFYTGIPDLDDDARWHGFWSAKLGVMGRQGVHVFSRSLRYRHRTVRLPDGTSQSVLVGEEKGIDVRIALDVISLAHRGAYDVAVILSQDQDLSEVAQEIRLIAREQGRWIKITCAFPSSPTSRNRRAASTRPIGSGSTAPCTTPRSTAATTGASRLLRRKGACERLRWSCWWAYRTRTIVWVSPSQEATHPNEQFAWLSAMRPGRQKLARRTVLRSRARFRGPAGFRQME